MMALGGEWQVDSQLWASNELDFLHEQCRSHCPRSMHRALSTTTTHGSD